MKFFRPFSTASVLFKEAAKKTGKISATKPVVVAKVKKEPKEPKELKPKKTPKPKPYRVTAADRSKNGKLNLKEQLRLFDHNPDETLNMDRVRLLKRHIHYQAIKDRQPAYNNWVKEYIQENPGAKLVEVAKMYSGKSDAEKAAIAEKYSSDTSANFYDKIDYRTIKMPKLSGLNVYLSEKLTNETRIIEENKLKTTVDEYKTLTQAERDEWVAKAMQKNIENHKRLQRIHKEVKALWEEELDQDIAHLRV